MKPLEAENVHKDSRRTLTQLLTANLKQVNLYTAKKGAKLGEHYHKKTVEYFYVIKGSLVYNNDTVVEEGAFFVVYPEEVHTLYCLEDVELMAFLTKPYSDNDRDIWKD